VTQVAVRVPASSANLGPGYDSFGLALGLHDLFSAESADEWLVDVGGEGEGELETGAGNQVARAMARVFELTGSDVRAAHVICENAIPTGRGLGSSAAAIVGGLVLANALTGEQLDREDILREGALLEGHPDNIAAALFGGLTLCWSDGEDEPSAALLQPGGGLACVLAVSDAPLATKTARGMLPAQVPHADAAFNAGRAGVLVAGLLIGSRELVAAGLADRIHEPYRAVAVPDMLAVREAMLSAGADGAALSGAGPTVVGLVTGADDVAALAAAAEVAARAAELLAEAEGRQAPYAVGIDRAGAVLL
jgi:homoserine kinase